MFGPNLKISNAKFSKTLFSSCEKSLRNGFALDEQEYEEIIDGTEELIGDDSR